MARKSFKKPSEDPPPVSSSASSSSSSSSSSSEEEEEETQTPQTQKTPNLNVKPIATKAMGQSSNSKKPRSKPSVNASSSSAGSKRSSESEQESKEVKRPKKKTGEEEGPGSAAAVVDEELKKTTGEDEKKQLFQRLFTEEDEIAVLKGMLDYIVKNGNPFADTNAFHDFIKNSLHTDVSKSQLMYKIRRLKKRFVNAGKGKYGEDRVIPNPHGRKIFELSKKIWGKEGLTGKLEASAAKSNGKKKGNSLKVDALDVCEPTEVDKKSWGRFSLFYQSFGVSGLDMEILKHGLDMIEGEKKEALEEKWRKLRIAELELFLKRKELVKELAELILEAYKSQDA